MRLLVHSSEAATWVAEQEGQMAGFGIVEWAENRDETVAYIQTLEVAPDWRGQGVGRELQLRLEAAARAEGAQRIWLHVDENNAPALGLYRTRGYRFLYREEDYYGPGSTALIHSKPL
jgi:ribosomal protein S18 acetylase RimI-like enzyme